MNWLKSAWVWISNLVGNNPKTRYLIFAFILIFLFLGVRCARSGELHLETGASIIHGAGPYLGLYYRFGETSTDSLHFEMGAQIYGSITGYGSATVPNNWAPFGMVVVARGPVSAGFGFAYLQNVDSLDGSHTSLTLKLGCALPWNTGIVVRHISNAGTTSVNEGRNVVALDWKLQ